VSTIPTYLTVSHFLLLFQALSVTFRHFCFHFQSLFSHFCPFTDTFQTLAQLLSVTFPVVFSVTFAVTFQVLFSHFLSLYSHFVVALRHFAVTLLSLCCHFTVTFKCHFLSLLNTSLSLFTGSKGLFPSLFIIVNQNKFDSQQPEV
jgi:hypothetical protein